MLETRIKKTGQLIAHENENDLSKFNQMVSRLAGQLAEENRLKRRSGSSGWPQLLNEEVEDFIAICFIAKSC